MSYWKCKKCKTLCLDLVAAQAHAVLEGNPPFFEIMEEVPPESLTEE